MNEELVIEGFAGPGGWSEGLRRAGFTGTAVGIEHDMAACRTATAAGHHRIRADVSTYPLEHLSGKVDGLIQSPPCTTFSQAGDGAGRLLLEVLATAMTRTMRGRPVMAATRRECARILRPLALAKMPKATRAERAVWVRRQAVMSVLAVEPARWALALRPRWIALEQVPAVLPLWRHLATLLREHGYRVWTGKLDAECYGVPQTRDRAILIARRDGLPVGPPVATHQPYRPGNGPVTEPDLFGDPLPGPVSMAEALGWSDTWTVEYQRGKGMAERHGDRPSRPAPAPAPAPTIRAGSGGVGTNLLVHMAPGGAASQTVDPRPAPAPAPAHTITSKGTAAWVLRNGPEQNATERELSSPAATIYASRSGNLSWKLRNGNQANACERRACEPAGTLFFGARTNAVDVVSPDGTRRVTVQEAALLQSFRPDYPWQGTKSQQYRQVGDAVPPLLAAAVLRPLVANLGEEGGWSS